MNSFGQRLRMHILGESHAQGVGIVLDGVPPGIAVDSERMQARMDQRRPGRGPLVSSRQESDTVHAMTGVFEGHTTGAPVTLWIANEDTRSKDYSGLRRTPRPGHSDYVAGVWARGFQDHRGGGHYSGRLTAPLVAAAALLEPLLRDHGVAAGAHLHQAGNAQGPATEVTVAAMHAAEQSAVFTAHDESLFVAALEEARAAKDSIGGTVAWRAEGVPVAWGDPFFDSVESRMAHLFFSVPAVKGVGFGEGWKAPLLRGSQHNDPFTMDGDDVRTTTNHAGGILGGRTTGMPLWGQVAIKPTSSIFRPQDTVDLETGKDASLELKGRHDPCIAVRAVPVVRACVELVLADFLLLACQEGHA